MWDFDFSLLVSCNSDEAIPDALAAAAGCAPLSASFIRPRAAAMQWTDLMDEVCGVLAAPPYRASRAALEAAAGALPASAPVLDAVRALA